MGGRERITAWVRSIQAGDDLAFAELVRAYQNIAVAYAASILGDRHLAEDAAQEAFLEVYRTLPSLREPAAFAGWFRTIVFKHCDRLTRRKSYSTAGLHAAWDAPSREPSPYEILESRDAEAAVSEALAALSASERAVVLLYYMGEHSHAAIGEFLGVTPNVVKTRLYSARKRLRKLMGDIEHNLQTVRPSSDPDFAGRVIGAALPLQLFFIDDRGGKHAAGSTVGSRTADVPTATMWSIEPRKTLAGRDWDTLLHLMREMQIPGLGAQVTDDLLGRICQLDHITYLDLRNSTELTDTGLRHLRCLPRLEYLNLSCPRITDRGLDVLRDLPRLKTFELYHQDRVSDEGLANLAQCHHLERVNLMGTRTGDGTIQALTGKPRLGHLLAGSNVTDDGLALLHRFPVFKTWAGGEPEMSLMTDFANPNYLWLNLNSPLTDRGLANLTGLDGIYAVNLFGTTGHAPFDDSGSAVTPAGLRHLAALPNLGWLGCCAQLCTDQAMSHIGQMDRLRFLMCQDAVAGDDGFAALSRSPSIEYIWGRRCYKLTGRGFRALGTMPALRGLSVSCRNVDDEAISTLARFPALRQLMPMDFSDSGFRHVGRCEQLEALYCMYCPETTDVATAHIAGLSRLKTYRAWSTQVTDRSLEILGRMASIESLLFYKCAGLTDAGLASLASLPRLREINLESLENITREGTAVFPPHVKVNVS